MVERFLQQQVDLKVRILAQLLIERLHRGIRHGLLPCNLEGRVGALHKQCIAPHHAYGEQLDESVVCSAGKFRVPAEIARIG